MNSNNARRELILDLVSGIVSAVVATFLTALRDDITDLFINNAVTHKMVEIILYALIAAFGVLAFVFLLIGIWQIVSAALTQESVERTIRRNERTKRVISGKIAQAVRDGTIPVAGIPQAWNAIPAPQLPAPSVVNAGSPIIVPPFGKRFRRIARGALVAAVALITVALGTHFMTPHGVSTVKANPTVTPLLQTFVVQSTRPWQDTGISVKVDEQVTIIYLSGRWTAGVKFYPYTDASGKSHANTICRCGEPLSGFSVDGLIGRIGGNGTVFFVGDQYLRLATVTGDLFLRINDRDDRLSDNNGTIRVKIMVMPLPPSTATPPQ